MTAVASKGASNPTIRQAIKDSSKRSTIPSTPVDQPGQKIDYAALLKEAEINFSEDIVEPPVCLQKITNGVTANICTYGNFSLAIGKAKSRKTFGTTLFMAVVTGHSNEHFRGELGQGKIGVYFDTEQGKAHVQKLAKRICRLTGKENPQNLKVYHLRKHSPAVRLAAIEHALYADDNVGFVVIDGIRDLVTSINDEEQASMITTKLLKWTEERSIHIMTILHQNKADNNARGHLGAELTNKAETVISISKGDEDKTISIVEAEQCRDKDFDPFAFTINLEELPEVVEHWEKKTKESKKAMDDISDINVFSVLSKCFSIDSSMSHGKLLLQIQYHYKELFGVNKLGDNATKELITKSRAKGWIKQEKDRAPYTIGQFTR